FTDALFDTTLPILTAFAEALLLTTLSADVLLLISFESALETMLAALLAALATLRAFDAAVDTMLAALLAAFATLKALDAAFETVLMCVSRAALAAARTLISFDTTLLMTETAWLKAECACESTECCWLRTLIAWDCVSIRTESAASVTDNTDSAWLNADAAWADTADTSFDVTLFVPPPRSMRCESAACSAELVLERTLNALLTALIALDRMEKLSFTFCAPVLRLSPVPSSGFVPILIGSVAIYFLILLTVFLTLPFSSRWVTSCSLSAWAITRALI